MIPNTPEAMSPACGLRENMEPCVQRRTLFIKLKMKLKYLRRCAGTMESKVPWRDDEGPSFMLL